MFGFAQGCKFVINKFLDNNSALLPMQSACAIYKDGNVFLMRYGLFVNANEKKDVFLSYEARLVHPCKTSCTRQCTVSLFMVHSDESKTRLFCNNITKIKVLNRFQCDLDRDFMITCSKEMIKSTLLFKFDVF